MARVFISYGQDLFERIVTELAVYLAENGEHIVFKDNATQKEILIFKSQEGDTTKYIKGSLVGIPIGEHFDTVLDQMIRNCDFFIAVLTRHSTRPDGFCLDEIARAREFSRKILPMRVEKVTAPLLICRIQWIELIIPVLNGKIALPDNWEVKRTEVFRRILEIINIGEPMPTTGIPILEETLTGEPFDFSAILIEKSRNFVGRRELLEQIERWVSSEESSGKVLMIYGNPGSGKTALCAKTPYIIHICNYDKAASVDVRKIIGNAAFQLSASIEEYEDLLTGDRKLGNLEKINNLSLAELFEWLFVTVLRDVKRPQNNVAIVIDGIDEIENENRREFLNIITAYISNIPSWIKIIMTGRRERDISAFFNDNNSTVIYLDEGRENEEDCKEYLRKQLDELQIQYNEEDICNIVINRNANFLYLYYLIEDLKQSGTKRLNTMTVPNGIGGFFYRSFNRYYSNKMEFYNQKVRPVLELLCVAKSEMNTPILAKISGLEEHVINDLIDSTGSFIKRDENDSVYFYHRSIRDWLTEEKDSGIYSIKKTDGENKIIRYIENYFSINCSLPDFEENSYIYKFGTAHIVENKKDALFERLFKSYNNYILNEMFYSFKYINASMAAAFLYKLKHRMESQKEQLLFSLCFEYIINSYIDDNMFQSAIDICEKLIDDSEDAFLTELYCAYSIAYGKLGKKDEAEEFAKNAVDSVEEHFVEGVYSQLSEAKACRIMGITFQNSGDSDKAEVEFLKAKDLLCKILCDASGIENTEKKVLEIHVYNWLIYIYGSLGKIENSEDVKLSYEYYKKELDSVNKLTNLMNTHRVQYKRTVAFNHLTECELVYLKYEDAERHANKSVVKTERLYRECPSSRIRRGLAISYNYRAAARKKLGRISGYVSDAQQGLEHITGLVEEYPGERARRDLALANKRMGEAMAADSEFAEFGKSEAKKKESVRYFEEAIEILKDLTGAAENEGDIQSVLFDSEDSFRNWFNLSDTYLILGLTYAKWGLYKTEAFNQLEEARKILVILEREKPYILFRKNLAEIYLYEGWIYLDKGDWEKGLSLFEKAKDLKLYADPGKKTVDYYSLMFRIFYAMGETHHKRNQENVSDRYYMDAVDLLDQYFENRLSDSDRKELLSLIKKQKISEQEQTRSELKRILSRMKDDYSPLILNKIIEFVILTIY